MQHKLFSFSTEACQVIRTYISQHRNELDHTDSYLASRIFIRPYGQISYSMEAYLVIRTVTLHHGNLSGHTDRYLAAWKLIRPYGQLSCITKAYQAIRTDISQHGSLFSHTDRYLAAWKLIRPYGQISYSMGAYLVIRTVILHHGSLSGHTDSYLASRIAVSSISLHTALDKNPDNWSRGWCLQNTQHNNQNFSCKKSRDRSVFVNHVLSCMMDEQRFLNLRRLETIEAKEHEASTRTWRIRSARNLIESNT